MPAPGVSGKWVRGAAPGAWVEDAECRRHEPETFFPERNRPGVVHTSHARAVKAAANICGVCPVLDDCHAHAAALNAAEPLWGVWAGREWNKHRGAR